MRLGPLFLPMPELMTLLFAIAVTLAAYAVLRHTDLGKALRASAEDAPVRRFVRHQPAAQRFAAGRHLRGDWPAWPASASRSPTSISPSQMYAWVGVVFATVMLGGLGSALGPLVAGIVIGVSEAVTMAVTSPSWAPLVSFTLLIVILLAAARAGRMKLRRAPVALLGGGLLLCALPLLRLPAFYESFLYLALFWIVLATSWNILSGYAGYFSFGHGAFFGAGVYTSATLAGKLRLAVPVDAAGRRAGGGGHRRRCRRRGVPRARRARRTVRAAHARRHLRAGDDRGQHDHRRRTRRLPERRAGAGAGPDADVEPVPDDAGRRPWRRCSSRGRSAISRFGAGLFAIHDDEDAAEVMGVPTYRWKLGALAISCALAGWAGGIHALFVSYVTTAETFNLTVPLTVVLMSILGGTRHWAGPAVGAVAITVLLFAFTGSSNAVLGKGVSRADPGHRHPLHARRSDA